MKYSLEHQKERLDDLIKEHEKEIKRLQELQKKEKEKEKKH
jgi:hypothetical protein